MNHRLQGIGMTSRRTRERMINRLIEQGIVNNAVLDAMRNIPRHIFMDEALASRAYEDTALPIGFNQTISQPYIVAKMTELLLEKGVPRKVLEIGTGSGYQTAVLARLADHVYSMERIAPLLKKAQQNLYDLKIRNVSFLHNDGGWGWPDHQPYDGILVAAAPPEIPKTLLDQLAVGGTMIIPIGRERGQELQRVHRTDTGFEIETLEPVTFVPFLSGKH
ncbi:MAG: protein-L-isoaspartate(D-aspartate) O-methyltransferase [Gammaproteobacteria bacterium]